MKIENNYVFRDDFDNFYKKNIVTFKSILDRRGERGRLEHGSPRDG